MSQLVILSGTVTGNKVVVSGSIPSSADIAAAIKATGGLATKADLDAAVADIEAKIAALPTGGTGGGGTPAITYYPATGPDAAFMPPIPPSTTPSPGAPNVTPAGGILAAGTFKGVAETFFNGANANLTGAGPGQTIVDATGFRPLYQKGAVLAYAGGVISNLTAKGAAIDLPSGGNAAGIYYEGKTVGVTINNVELYGSNEGLRCDGGSLTAINGGYVHHNGSDSSGTGNTHNVYLTSSQGQDDRSVVTMTGWTFEAALFAHEFKSRLFAHVMTGNKYISRVIPGSNGSYLQTTQLGGNGACINVPNGGDWKGTNETLVKGPGVLNREFIVFVDDHDGGLWPGHSGQMVCDGYTFDNQTGQQGYIRVGSGGTVTLHNPTFKGGTPVFSGNVVVTGTVTNA